MKDINLKALICLAIFIIGVTALAKSLTAATTETKVVDYFVLESALHSNPKLVLRNKTVGAPPDSGPGGVVDFSGFVYATWGSFDIPAVQINGGYVVDTFGMQESDLDIVFDHHNTWYIWAWRTDLWWFGPADDDLWKFGDFGRRLSQVHSKEVFANVYKSPDRPWHGATLQGMNGHTLNIKWTGSGWEFWTDGVLTNYFPRTIW